MKSYYYQLIFLGTDFDVQEEIISSFNEKIKALGVSDGSFKIINRDNFDCYTDSSPSFCLYSGGKNDKVFVDIELIDRLITDASLVLPIIEDSLDNFNQCIPSSLSNYNGISVSTEDRRSKVEKIANNILEAFSLLRKNRRVFISYKRNESSSVAIQLYEALEQSGFDVFLDTHSIRPSEPFQDELWHRLADSDVVVLLNTANFLQSHWTTEELANANKMLLGIIIVSWPDHSILKNNDAQISYPIQLNEADFNLDVKIPDTAVDLLSTNRVNEIIKNVESIRARTLAARRDNLITNFMKMAKESGFTPELDSYKVISMIKNGEEVILVPAVGIPNSLNYESSSKFIKDIQDKETKKIYILFDQTNIRDFWLNHLKWLDGSLKIKSLSILEAYQWLNN